MSMMTVEELEKNLRALRLSGMISTLSIRAMQVDSHEMNFIEAVCWLVQDELDRRRTRLLERRFTLLVQGAQSVVTASQRRDDVLCLLARRLLAQGKRRNTVVLAVANRMARIMYVIIKHGERYRKEANGP